MKYLLSLALVFISSLCFAQGYTVRVTGVQPNAIVPPAVVNGNYPINKVYPNSLLYASKRRYPGINTYVGPYHSIATVEREKLDDNRTLIIVRIAVGAGAVCHSGSVTYQTIATNPVNLQGLTLSFKELHMDGGREKAKFIGSQVRIE